MLKIGFGDVVAKIDGDATAELGILLQVHQSSFFQTSNIEKDDRRKTGQILDRGIAQVLGTFALGQESGSCVGSGIHDRFKKERVATLGIAIDQEDPLSFLNSDHAMASIVEIDRVVRESRFDGVPSRLSEKGLNAPGDHFPWPYLIDHQWLQFILYPRARLVRPRREIVSGVLVGFPSDLYVARDGASMVAYLHPHHQRNTGRKDFFFRLQLVDGEILMLSIDAID